MPTPMPTHESDPYLKPPVAADYLGLSVGTLGNRRSAGLGPTFVRLPNRAIRYRKSALDAFLAAGEVIEAAA